MRKYAKQIEARSHKRKKPSKSGGQAYSAEGVAELTGLNVNGVYKGARNGAIPSLRVGKRWIFPRAAIDGWLQSARRPSAAA